MVSVAGRQLVGITGTVTECRFGFEDAAELMLGTVVGCMYCGCLFFECLLRCFLCMF
jgi:hypothetical protein